MYWWWNSSVRTCTNVSQLTRNSMIITHLKFHLNLFFAHSYLWTNVKIPFRSFFRRLFNPLWLLVTLVRAHAAAAKVKKSVVHQEKYSCPQIFAEHFSSCPPSRSPRFETRPLKTYPPATVSPSPDACLIKSSSFPAVGSSSSLLYLAYIT